MLGSLAAGMSFDEMAGKYDLTPEDIRAALALAGEMLNAEPF